MAVAVDLDQHFDLNALSFAEVMHCLGRFGGIEDHAQLATLSDQRGHLRQLHRCDADRVQNVPDSVSKEIARLRERRDRDRDIGPARENLEDIDRLRGFDMRAQSHAERGDLVPHPRGIADQPLPVEDQRRGRKLEDRTWLSRSDRIPIEQRAWQVCFVHARTLGRWPGRHQ